MQNYEILGEIGDSDLVVDYTYDGLGRRIEKVDAVAAVTTRYYYDDQRVILETEDSGSGFGDARYYIWGNYIDELLVMRKLTETASDYYYAHDHLFSPAVLFEDDGAVVERYEYDAYGKVRIMNANYVNLNYSLLGNTYYFTGRELDTLDAGNCTLMYYRAIIKWVICENIFMSQNQANPVPNTIVPDTIILIPVENSRSGAAKHFYNNTPLPH